MIRRIAGYGVTTYATISSSIMYLLTDPLFGGKAFPGNNRIKVDGWVVPSVPEISRSWDGREDSRREPREASSKY